MTIFLVSITLLNVVLWIIFIIRFKRLFSTDSIIEQTKTQINKIVKDMDSSTERDIFLASESVKRINNAIADAEQKMEIYNQASKRLHDLISETDKINKSINKKNSIYKDIGQAVPVAKTTSYSTTSNINAYLKNKPVQENSSAKKEEIQTDLFSQVEQQNNDLQLQPKKEEQNTDSLQITQIIQEETQESNEQQVNPLFDNYSETSLSHDSSDLTENVKYLFNQGFDVKEIASKLSCSIIQVQFIIDML